MTAVGHNEGGRGEGGRLGERMVGMVRGKMGYCVTAMQRWNTRIHSV